MPASIDAGSLIDAQTVRTHRPRGLKPIHTQTILKTFYTHYYVW